MRRSWQGWETRPNTHQKSPHSVCGLFPYKRAGSPEPDDFGAARQITVLLHARPVGSLEIAAVGPAALAERNAQPQLDRAEHQSFVTQADAQSEGRVKIILENIGVASQQTEIGEAEQRDTETERLVGREKRPFRY